MVQVYQAHVACFYVVLCFLVNLKPTKKKILDLVVPYVSPKWYEFGVKLLKEEQEAQLDVIRSDYNNDSKTCCREMFWYWLRSNPDASWYQLIDCLKSPAVELHALAADIETKFTGIILFKSYLQVFFCCCGLILVRQCTLYF